MSLDDAARCHRVGEDPKPRVPDDAGEVVEEQLEAGVGLVDSITVHRLTPCHAREWDGQVASAELARLPCTRDGVFERGKDVVLIDEGHLDVELREFRLAVGAQVLVAHAMGQLEVPVESGDHGELFVELG